MTTPLQPPELPPARRLQREMAATNMALDGAMSNDTVLQRLADRSRELVDADFAAVSTFDQRGVLEQFIYSGISVPMVRTLGTPPVGRGLLGDLARRDTPIRIDDVQQSDRFTGWPAGHPDMCAFLGVPIRALGTTIGSLYMTRLRGRAPFTLADETSASVMALQIAAVVSRLKLDEEIARRDADLEAMFDASPAAIFVTDLETERLVVINAASRALTGFTAAEAIGKTTAELGTWADASARAAAFAGYRNGETIKGVHVEIRAKSGELIDVIASSAFVTFRNRPAVVTVLQDVTESRRASWLRERLDREQSLTTLAGGIAHDFNNLLTTMLLTVDLLEMELPEDTPVGSMLGDLRASALRAQDLAAAMLTYAGASRSAFAEIDLNQVVRTVRRDLERSAGDTGYGVDVELWPSALQVRGDADQLELLLRSLVINGHEAVSGGAGRVRISVFPVVLGGDEAQRLRPPLAAGEYAAVRVADSGDGMDTATLEKMFDPFYTTKFVGRGLGLASALGIARVHRGGFDVASAPGKGTTITFYMPIAEAV